MSENYMTTRERISHPRKFECLDAIHEHLVTVGPHNYQAIYDRFPDIRKDTIGHWFALAKEGTPEGLKWIKRTMRDLRRKLKGVGIDTHEDARRRGVAHIAQNLPAAPSPAYIANDGPAGMAKLDFQQQIYALYADAMLLRKYSIADATGPDGGERIKNPNTFERSIARRTAILRTAIDTLQQLWDLRRMTQFYETIIEEIGHESPECQQRILKRLADLNSRTGMTMPMTL